MIDSTRTTLVLYCVFLSFLLNLSLSFACTWGHAHKSCVLIGQFLNSWHDSKNILHGAYSTFNTLFTLYTRSRKDCLIEAVYLHEYLIFLALGMWALASIKHYHAKPPAQLTKQMYCCYKLRWAPSCMTGVTTRICTMRALYDQLDKTCLCHAEWAWVSKKATKPRTQDSQLFYFSWSSLLASESNCKTYR